MFYRCESGGEEICLSLEQVCDGIADCTDGRDEATCGTYFSTVHQAEFHTDLREFHN